MNIGENMRKILVTSALPYANGSLHLGHMVEHIQADIWVRFQKSQKHQCYFICGEDSHGTPMMLAAEKAGVLPEDLAKKYQLEHHQDLQDFLIGYDNFHTTHSEENKELSSEIYLALQKKGDIETKTIQQAFDQEKKIFLPDRYVRGECPKCSAENQYGDGCEVCGAHYDPLDLKNPRSAISGSEPILKETEHYFFCLNNYQEMLSAWIKQGHLQEEVANKLQEWFKEGLKEWDISRDEPYFGFEIPGAQGKYFYVWLDAPIGYMASFKNLCVKKGLGDEEFTKYWQEGSQTELYHFIGKDIVYFHALFWPAILSGSGYRTPSRINVHGFLTVNGEKMSKSRGTFITARQYLNNLPAEYLRYYFAAKLSDGLDDIDFNLNDFVQRVNADLVGKFINIASRCSGFISKNFSGELATEYNAEGLQLYNSFVDKQNVIAKLYDERQYSKAVREIMLLADEANKFIDANKPWVLIKDQQTKNDAHVVCSVGINLFKILTTYLQPILPGLSKQIMGFLQVDDLAWEQIQSPMYGHKINKFKPMIVRVDIKEVMKMLEKTATESEVKPEESELEKLAETITIDDFSKVDLRVAKIVDAQSVPDAKKLIKLTLDVGLDKREVFAGIKSAYTPEDLIGKLTVVVANLAPRKMRFGLSSGMVLVAGPGGEDMWILEPNSKAQPGMRIR